MPEDTKRKALRLALDAEDWTTLERAAKLEKLSKAEVLRRALRRYAAEPASIPERFQNPTPAVSV